jgi:hypothetical protein
MPNGRRLPSTSSTSPVGSSCVWPRLGELQRAPVYQRLFRWNEVTETSMTLSTSLGSVIRIRVERARRARVGVSIDLPGGDRLL